MTLLAAHAITKSFGSRLILNGADLAVEPRARKAAGGPNAEGRARASLLEIGLTISELSLPTRTLSGGQRKLIALAACLEQKPDVLLLDEPEAHLDNEGRARVELLARRFEGALVAVSHDRYLLDEIVNQIASLDRGQIRSLSGSDRRRAAVSASSSCARLASRSVTSPCSGTSRSRSCTANASESSVATVPESRCS